MLGFNVYSVLVLAVFIIGTLGDTDPAPQEIDGGIVQCKAEHDDGDTRYYFNREGAIEAFGTFCKSLAKYKFIIGGADGISSQSLSLHDGKATSLNLWLKATAGDDLIPLDFDHDGPGSESACNDRFTTLLETCKVIPFHPNPSSQLTDTDLCFHHIGDPIKRTSDSSQGGSFTRDGIVSSLGL